MKLNVKKLQQGQTIELTLPNGLKKKVETNSKEYKSLYPNVTTKINEDTYYKNLPDVNITAKNWLSHSVRKGMNEAGKNMMTGIGTVALVGTGAAGLVSAPLAFIGSTAGGIAGDYLTNKATDIISKGKYKNWGEFAGDKTGIPAETMVFTNPGAIFGGGFGSLLKPKHFIKSGKYLLNKTEPYLMGDKRIPMMSGYKPKSNLIENGKFLNNDFKSEIDWGKWNSEIPANKPLMDEYLQIEKTAKQNGTWMKPLSNNKSRFTKVDEIQLKNGNNMLVTGKKSNGQLLSETEIEVLQREQKRLKELYESSLKYDGTPEQFVQELSANFPKNSEITYRGSNGHNSFVGKLNQSENKNIGSIFTANREAAEHYGSTDILDINQENYHGLLELIYKRSNNSLNLGNQGGRGWKDIKMPDGTIKSTNEIAELLQKDGLDYAILKNLYDGIPIKEEVIFNHKPGNYLKSRWYNNGMFDMTNPNIYKAVVPAAGLYGLTQSKKQEGVPKHQEGGLIYPKVNQLINRTNQKNIDFVNRLKDPNRKFITNWENSNEIATHKMSWATDDEGAIIYPEVQNIKGKLIDFTRPPYNKYAGYDSAIQNNDTIRTTPKVAQEYTTNYKRFYPKF